VVERNGVAIRPLELEDIPRLYEWHRDLEIDAASGWVPRMARSRFERRYEELVNDPPEDLEFLAVTRADILVGYVELAQVSHLERRAAIGFVVGDRAARRQGVGSAAVVLAVDFGFQLKDLDRVYAEVYAFNAPSLRLLERVGFTREGVLRQHDVHQGRRVDVVVWGMLRDEFYARYPSAFPQPGAF
jgi:RimJ/RimL family protein N-acetyltransferase